MQSPCKLVFTVVSLLAVPHGHVYSDACNRLDVDWAVWLKPEPIAGKSVCLCMCAPSLLHTAASLRFTNLVSVSNPGILPPALSREDCLHIVVGVTSNISGYKLSAV